MNELTLILSIIGTVVVVTTLGMLGSRRYKDGDITEDGKIVKKKESADLPTTVGMWVTLTLMSIFVAPFFVPVWFLMLIRYQATDANPWFTFEYPEDRYMEHPKFNSLAEYEAWRELNHGDRPIVY